LADEREYQLSTPSMLDSIQASLERRYAVEKQNSTAEAELLKQVLSQLAPVSVRFLATIDRSETVERHSEVERDQARLGLSNALKKIIYDLKYSAMLARTPFLFSEGIDPYKLSDLPISVLDAFASVERNLSDSVWFPEPLFEMAPTLRQIVPRQKIAPVQFQISNSKIVVSDRKSLLRKADSPNIEAAKAELQRNGDKIISELLLSNCDRRLLASVQELQAQFQGEIDAIKIGLMNIGCEMMCNSSEAELPVTVAAMLRAHTRGVQMFVGQFPEWARFVENAAEADLDQADITSLKAASQTLVEAMKKQPELVDPAVPRTIAYLSEMLDSPTKAGKRAAFAVLRSLENLVSRVFGYGAEFLEKTAEKSVDKASTAAGRRRTATTWLNGGCCHRSGVQQNPRHELDEDRC
jgi:hypothetical protein